MTPDTTNYHYSAKVHVAGPLEQEAGVQFCTQCGEVLHVRGQEGGPWPEGALVETGRYACMLLGPRFRPTCKFGEAAKEER